MRPTIFDLIEARARRAPGAVALLAPGRVPLTSRGLQEQTAGVAAALRARGVGRGDRVALVLENGPELASAFLGIASVAACAPLNPGYREAELEFYFSDLDPRALIVGGGMDSPARDIATSHGIPIVELSPLSEDAAGRFALSGGGAPGHAPGNVAEPGDVALVLHTSGTTSRPKMVPLTHRNLCASAGNVAATLGLTEDDRCLNVMPLFHIHGLVAAVLASLAAGGSVVCTPGFYAPRFFAWIAELSPTWYTAVPTMHQAILTRAEGSREVVERTRLRLIRSSSSALPPQVLGELERVFGVPVIESYGMTEAAHQMASNPLPPGAQKLGSVGQAAGPEIAILDEVGAVLAPGTVGEIAIRGENVFAGYEGNPEANESAFTGGWFRTGDEGYLDEDGYLFLRGRIKEIINRGGEKISPREVDEVLLDHPAVAQAVTFAVADGLLGEDVAAAVVLRDGATATEASLEEFVATRLAAFKVPREIVLVGEIPKGSTGKLQRLGLAERLGVAERRREQPSEPGPYAAPRTPLEQELATLWAEILGAARVGIDDDFFALGGDSMLGAQLLSTLRDRFADRVLPLTALVRAPTVARMAALVELGATEASGSSLVVIQAEGESPPLFFVHSLDGHVMGFAALARRLGPDQPFYGLQARGLEGREPPHERVEDMASDYLSEVRALAPTGPYFLGGVCMGGPIALEMAQRLLDDGQEVALLALVDPRIERSAGLRYYRRRAHWYVRQGEPGRAVIRKLVRTLREAWRRGTATIDTEELFRREMRRVRDSYVVSPYPGRVTLFASAEYLTSRGAWERLALGGVDWQEIPGAHETIFRAPAVGRLAEQLAGALRRARTGEGARGA